MTSLLLSLMLMNPIAPAYAEIECHTGLYTGMRYRYPDDPFQLIDYLYSNKQTLSFGTALFRNNCIVA